MTGKRRGSRIPQGAKEGILVGKEVADVLTYWED